MNRKTIVPLAAAVLTATIATAGIATLADGAAGPAARPAASPGAIQAKAIATASDVSVRVELLARRVGRGSAPTAQVTATTYRRAGGRWHRVASKRIAGTYFWHTVTAPHAICRLDLVTAGRGKTRSHATVQLLVTPSLGCGKAQTVALPG